MKKNFINYWKNLIIFYKWHLVNIFINKQKSINFKIAYKIDDNKKLDYNFIKIIFMFIHFNKICCTKTRDINWTG